MKVNLGVLERIVLAQVLPPPTDFVSFITAKLRRQLRQELEFDVKELKDWELEQDPKTSSVKWNTAKAKDKDFDVSDMLLQVVQDILAQADKAGKLSEHHVTICEKFEYEGSDDET